MNLEYSNLYKHKYNQVNISPNGNYLANSLDNRLVIRDHGTGLTILMVYESMKPIDYIEWAPNSEYILSVNYEFSRIDIWSTLDINFRATIKDSRMAIVKVKWSPDSKNIMYTVDMKVKEITCCF
jgi:WD40 repeat protein